MAELDRILDRYDLKTLEEAIARVRRARDRELEALGERKRKLEAELSRLSALIGDGQNGASPNERRKRGRRKGKPRPKNKMTMAEALAKVLRHPGKPMHYKDLAAAVAKRKLYRTTSKNPHAVVVLTLTGNKRFKRVKPGMYALR